MASLVGLLPQVVLAPFIGPLINRWSRKKIMMLADGMIALFTLILSFLFFFDIVEIWHIFIVLFLRSLSGAFHSSASFSTIPIMVPKERLTNVGGLDQAFNGVMNIIGAPLGAILLKLIDIQGLLWIDVFTAVVAITILFFIHVPSVMGNTTEKMLVIKSYFHILRDGFKYLITWRGLVFLVVFSLILNATITPAFSLLALFVTDHFQKGVMELGLLQSIFGVGILVSGILMSAWGGFKKKMYSMMLGVALMGIGMVLFGISPEGEIIFGYFGMAFVGFGMVVTNAPMSAAMQEVVHPEMQGRLGSLVTSVSSLGTPIGLIIAGPVSDWIGINIWFFITGIIFMSLSLIIPFNKDLMLLTNGHPKGEEFHKKLNIKLYTE